MKRRGAHATRAWTSDQVSASSSSSRRSSSRASLPDRLSSSTLIQGSFHEWLSNIKDHTHWSRQRARMRGAKPVSASSSAARSCLRSCPHDNTSAHGPCSASDAAILYVVCRMFFYIFLCRGRAEDASGYKQARREPVTSARSKSAVARAEKGLARLGRDSNSAKTLYAGPRHHCFSTTMRVRGQKASKTTGPGAPRLRPPSPC
jgi:hypothetical protein